ncbi:MAG: GAP family protein [Mycobacterium sp.]
MWIYVLYMGFGMAFDPFRLGFVLVLTSRRRPILNLFAFWLGGMTASIGLAIVVLILMRDFSRVAIDAAMSVVDDVRSSVAIFTGSRLQITFGVLMLLVVATVRVRERARSSTPVAVGGGGGELEAPPRPGGPAAIFAWFAARTHDMLDSPHMWPVFVAGAASTVPPVEGVAVLTVIMASRADLGTQFSAFIVFILILLAIIEIPLLSYLVRPDKTLSVVLQVQSWAQAHLRQIIQTILAIGGISAVVQGVAGL